MEDKKVHSVIYQVNQVLKAAVVSITLLLLLMAYLLGSHYLVQPSVNSHEQVASKTIVDGLHVESGLIDAPGLFLVIENCTACHSSKLITQNRMSLAGWKSTIRWMQETQNLWDLKQDEKAILDYLATNYAPTKKGRRANLTEIEWFELE